MIKLAGMLASTGGNISRPVLVFAALFVISMSQACQYPRDVEGSLDEVRGGVLNVGVTPNPPWVIRSENGATGLEPAIVVQLAKQLDADVRWHWGTETELLGALENFQLHLAIGGMTQNKRLSTVAAPTKPYFVSHSTVGFGQSDALPESLEGLAVRMRRLSPLEEPLAERGAEPVIDDRPHNKNMPVAGPSWWLRAHDLTPGPWELATDRHVMALPKGENAWMLRVQKHLNNLSGLEQRLERLERER